MVHLFASSSKVPVSSNVLDMALQIHMEGTQRIGTEDKFT